MSGERKSVPVKILLVGETGSGKTQLMTRYANDTYTNEYTQTIGADFRSKHIDVENTDVALQIWDTAGAERFHSIAEMYYRGTNCCIVVCDLSDKEGVNKAKKWMNNIKQKSNDAPIIFVGNKLDLEDNPNISKNKTGLKKYAEENGCKCFFTSAKKNIGLDPVFEEAAKQGLIRLSALESGSSNMLQAKEVNVSKEKDDLKDLRKGCDNLRTDLEDCLIEEVSTRKDKSELKKLLEKGEYDKLNSIKFKENTDAPKKVTRAIAQLGLLKQMTDQSGLYLKTGQAENKIKTFVELFEKNQEKIKKVPDKKSAERWLKIKTKISKFTLGLAALGFALHSFVTTGTGKGRGFDFFKKGRHERAVDTLIERVNKAKPK